MEDVLERFNSLGDCGSENVSQNSNFEGLYKNAARLGSQEDRRKEILEIQKSNRNSNLDKFRGILAIVNEVEEKLEWNNGPKVYYRPSIYVAGFNKASSKYNDVLMLSEWMIEKPSDFCENWFCVPCPKGTRMLVIATKGQTKCYSKYGQFKFQTRTALPGGSPCERSGCCVLDCFYVPEIETMFVVDLLVWNSQPMTDGETEFRHYWLSTKFPEITELQKISKKNKLLFSLLPKVSCDDKSLNEFFMKYPAFDGDLPTLDGLLFYHKKAHYFGGETPLVGWLYPYMVPEVLGNHLTIHPSYLVKPLDYTNQAEFIQKFEQQMIQRQNERKKKRASCKTSGDDSDITDRDNKEEIENDMETIDQGDTEDEKLKKTENLMEAEVNPSAE